MQGTRTMGVQVLSASSLMNEPVINPQGESLGKVEDYMLDLDKGCVSYAVLSFGGILGMGDKLFAIPWQAMTVDTDRKAFILDVPKERLENAPGFDKDNWPQYPDQEFMGNVYDYYQVERYW